jgi:hypothetical protein
MIIAGGAARTPIPRGGVSDACTAPSAAVATLMLTRITCPHCGHVGATAASLPRVLICSQCEHGALIRSGTPARSPTVEREERAAERAAWERHAPPATAG